MKRNSALSQARKDMAAANKKRPATMTPLPKDQWPEPKGAAPVEVWISRYYLAQVYDEGKKYQMAGKPVLRVSVCRTTINDNWEWEENLSWDELMEIKRQIGRGEEYAVEVLPADKDIVNVANMRHFWIMPESLVGWQKGGA